MKLLDFIIRVSSELNHVENKTKSVLYFESAAYDAASNTIFLTGNRETRTIFSLSNKPGSRLDTFYTDNQKQPTSITMDVCTRYIGRFSDI